MIMVKKKDFKCMQHNYFPNATNNKHHCFMAVPLAKPSSIQFPSPKIKYKLANEVFLCKLK